MYVYIAFFSSLLKFGYVGLCVIEFMSDFILSRYFSTSGELLGGIQVLLVLNGCISFGGWFLKKYLSLLDLSNCDNAFCNAIFCIFLLGTKDSPLVCILFCATVRVFVDRFVMYL